MRDAWIKITFGEVFKIVAGKYVPKEDYVEDGRYWIYGSNSVMGKLDKYLVEEPHVVMAAIGAYAGAVRYSDEPSWINNNAMALVPNQKVLAKYLHLWLECRFDLKRVVVGTGQPYVQRPLLLQETIGLPPLPEQRRIVDLISSVDSYIEALQQQLESAKRSRDAVLHELLTAGGNDWVETNLLDVVEVLDRFRKPINATERESRQGSVPYYGANGQTGWIDDFLFDEELVLLGEDAIDFANPSARKAYLIDGPSWVNNHAHVLRAKTDKVESYFLAESLNKVDFSQYVSFGTRSKLTQASMNGIAIPLPPLPEQKRIVDMVNTIDEVISQTELTTSKAQNLRAGLLSDLLSGDHAIPNSYDKVMGAA